MEENNKESQQSNVYEGYYSQINQEGEYEGYYGQANQDSTLECSYDTTNGQDDYYEQVNKNKTYKKAVSSNKYVAPKQFLQKIVDFLKRVIFFTMNHCIITGPLVGLVLLMNCVDAQEGAKEGAKEVAGIILCVLNVMAFIMGGYLHRKQYKKEGKTYPINAKFVLYVAYFFLYVYMTLMPNAFPISAEYACLALLVIIVVLNYIAGRKEKLEMSDVVKNCLIDYTIAHAIMPAALFFLILFGCVANVFMPLIVIGLIIIFWPEKGRTHKINK